MKTQNSFPSVRTQQFTSMPRPATFLLLLWLALLTLPAGANTLSWSGSGSSGNWSDSGNWGFAGTPATGDTLIFPALQPRPVNTNNIAGLVLAQIRFAGPGGGYVISGNAFTVTNGIAATNTAGANTISNAITLATIDQPVVVGSGVSLSLAGQLSGSVGVVKSGAGTLTYTCAGSNPYTGTTRVNAGVLQLNVGGTSAVGGALIIGDGSGTAATVQHLQGSEISDSAAVTIYTGGVLDLNNFSEVIGNSLTLSGGTAQSGTGTLALSANNTITVNGISTISGNLNIGGGTCAIVANSALTVTAAISGTASITKSGTGTVFFSSANSYSGLTVIQNGVLWIQNSLGLGVTNSGTVVSNGATLAMSGSIGVTNESLTLNGLGVSTSWGALDAENTGTNLWVGPITVNADSTIVPYHATTHLRIIGPISGAGGVEKFANSSGTLYFEGNSSNSYAGLTKIIAGTNLLAKTAVTDGAIPHDLQIGDATHAATVRYLIPNQIPNSSIVTLYDDCLLDLNGLWEGLGGLVMYGSTVQMGTGFLDLYAPGTITSFTSTNSQSVIFGKLGLKTPATFEADSLPLGFWFQEQLVINATIYGPNGFAKTGPMTVELVASNSFTGPVTVNDGILTVVNDYALGTTDAGTVVSNGATLQVRGGIQVGLEALTLNGSGSGGYTDNAALWSAYGTNSWAGPVTLATDSVVSAGYPGSTNTQLTLSGPISGPGGFTKIGPGIVSLTGNTANTYLGASVVNAGTLLLGKTLSGGAIPGALAIGTNCKVRNLQPYQLNSPSKRVTILNSGLFDLAGYNEWIGPLFLQAAQITTGSGLLYLGGDIVVNGSSVAQSKIIGNATLWNGTKTITVTNHNYSPDGVILANLSGNGVSGIVKNGDGEFSLAGSNSFPGPVTVNGGTLMVQSSNALGNTNTPATVNLGGNLFLDGSVNIGLKPLSLNGTGNPFGALNAGFGNGSWAGNITLAGDTRINVYGGASLTLSGAIDGPGALVKTDLGSLTLRGATPNTYAGPTTVSAGTLILGKNSSTVAVPGALDISGTVKLAESIQTAYTSDVTIQSSGRFETAGFIDYMDSLNGSGQLDLTSNGWLFTGWNGGASLFSGVISGSGDLYCAAAVTLTGTNTYTGTTHLYHGTLLVNGYQPQSPVDFYSYTDGTLGGTGVVGPVYVTGNLQPGNSPGCLTSSNLTFTSNGVYTVQLNGSTPCLGYDQMIVHGTNNLANATLSVSLGFAPSGGQEFVIIKNDGVEPITGTFAGLPNGATFNIVGTKFRIGYNGGDGNDVVLAVVNPPGTSVTLNAADQGWYDISGHHNAGNPNYYAGDQDTNRYRNFFVFNVPLSLGEVAKAELLINCYGTASPYGQEAYVLRQVSTPISTLTLGGSGLTNIFNDLGDGSVYAVRKISTTETGERAIIPLNVTLINDLVAATGGQFALGGSVATLDGASNNQYLFASSGYDANDVQLRLTFGTTALVNATAQGWYDNAGGHRATEPNYFVGEDSGTNYHNFFVFGLPAMSGPPMGAELLLRPNNIFSPTNWVNYQLRDVTTPISTLTNAASGATGIYADLANGEGYGGRELYTNEAYLPVNSSIPLNSAFTAAALANSGGQIALGGAITLEPTPNNEGAFGYSTGSPGDIQLWLSFIPTSVPPPFFVAKTPTALGGGAYKFVLSGTTGTTNEIQASTDFANWDAVQTLYMTNTTTTFFHTNAASPYRYFRARLLQ